MHYSYADALVEKVEAYHAERVQSEKEVNIEHVHNGYKTVEYNGVYVREELLPFIHALEPLGYKFAVSSSVQSKYTGGGRYVFEEVEVYREGDEYTLGRIGYTDMNKRTSTSKMMYTVYSRVITNSRIRESDWRYHVKSSLKLEQAIKHAKMFLRIHSPIEICNSTLLAMAYRARDRVNQAGQKSISIRRDILHDASAEVMQVLVTASKGSVAPIPSVLQEKIAEYEAVYQQYKTESNRVRPAYHVCITGLPDAQRASIIQVDNIVDKKYSYGDKERIPSDTPVTVVDVADIPEDIMGRVAVLSMNPVDHYIEGLGYKVTSRSYWIEREGL